MKWISFFPLLALACIFSCGCFQPIINFDPPPYILDETGSLPSRVDNAFKREHPNGTIRQIESLIWPPTGKTFYRITFELNGELMQIEYREGGTKIGNTLQHASKQQNENADRVYGASK